jgi:superfamily II DNA or RNA helicase
MNLIDAPLGRLELFSGNPVSLYRTSGPCDGEIIENLGIGPKGLWRYRVRVADGDVILEETQLQPIPPDRANPISLFQTNSWGSAKTFRRRQSFLKMIEMWHTQTAGIPSLMGMRIEPMGHQLYALRRVLSSRRPRFILADEVGLGKTIEAGLVLQSLIQEKPDLRVLIIAPGSMSRQWFSEIYLRFGARAFGLLEAEDLSKRGEEAGKFVRARLAGGRVIISTTALMASPTLCNWIVEDDWDVVVLDEAHRISVTHQLYPIVAQLASRSPGFLALSATPSSKELQGLSSLLALVSPEAYQPGNTEALEQRIAGQKKIWRALNGTIRYLDAATRESGDLDSDDLEFLAGIWDGVGDDDPVIADLTAEMRNGSCAAVEDLVPYVQEFHRIDQRLVRTRRTTLSTEGRQWPARRLETIEYESSNSEINLIHHLAELRVPDDSESSSAGLRLLYERICGTCPSHALELLEFRRGKLAAGISIQREYAFERLLQDPEPGYELLLQKTILASATPLDGELHWLRTAIDLAEEWGQRDHSIPSRFHAVANWIRSHLEADVTNKVLVFCQDADIVERFASFLRDRLASSIEEFHFRMEESELSKVALRFQRVAECRVLVSDELGGEGRNFQIASAVVHLDTPWSVSRIEQRIGRLDRIARPADRDVLSAVALGPGDMERTIFETYRGIFRVYDHSIGGLEFGLPVLQRRVLRAMCLGARALSDIRDELREAVSAEMNRSDEAFECALDSSKRQLSEGAALAKGLADAQLLGGGKEALLAWAERIGFRVRLLEGSEVEIVADPDAFRGPRERFLYAGRKVISGTFKHRVAMQNDSVQFFGPGHPLIDFLVREFQLEGEGRSAAGKVAVPLQYEGRIFLSMGLHCSPNLEGFGGNELPPALRLRVIEEAPARKESLIMEILPGEDPPIREIPAEEHEFVAKLCASHNSERLTPMELNGVAPLSQVWLATSAATAHAISQTRSSREELRNDALRRIQNSLRFDRSYLTWRAAQNDSQAAKDLDCLDRIPLAIQSEKIEVDSVYLVLGVRTQ